MISNAEAAEASLHPMRRQLLAELSEPRSATGLAARLGMPRQKVNYHLRILEQHGLVELVEERRRGNFTERVVQASAASYVISPGTLGEMQPDPAYAPDRLSARWLLALASRLVRDVGTLLAGARKARRAVATFAMDGEIRFISAADRAAFAEELSEAITGLVAKYHRDRQPGDGEGKLHRLVVAVHPAVPADAQPPGGRGSRPGSRHGPGPAGRDRPDQ
ncbi:ArsR/SmtB family transcription factor [Sediminivirga luteola]